MSLKKFWRRQEAVKLSECRMRDSFDFGFWNSARPSAIWDELADETQVAAITYAKLLVSNQVWARACPGATCQDLPTRPKQLERGVYIIRFSESGLGQGFRI